MTIEEIYKKYKDIFILVIESVGEETGNNIYKDVENILEGKSIKQAINEMIEQEVPFPVFISLCIVALLEKIHGREKLEKMEPEESYKLADFIFQNYLKKPTRKFTSTYGLPVINSLDTYFRILKVKNDGTDN